MSPKEKLAALQKAMRAVIDAAKGRDLTDDEMADLETKSAEAVDLKAQIERGEKSKALIDSIGAMKSDTDPTDEAPAGRAKSLGAHFIKSVGGDTLSRARGVSGASLSAPEFKANTDTSVTGGSEGALRGLLVEVDQTVVRREPDDLTPVSSLLGQGQITVGNAIQYFVEGAIEGDVSNVAEGGAKPQLHVQNPTPELAAAKKIAGWTNVTDEYFEDLPLLASEIDGRLIRRLARRVEQQVIAGSGSGAELRGLLQTPGIQALTDIAPGAVSLADSILEATSLVEDGSDLVADAVLLNRADYVALRKAKDDNGQYYGGGFFSGTYGNGAIVDGSSLWGGLRIAISPFIPAGTALVGAFADAATLYGKGGVSVDMTNSHASNFTSNIVTLRAEVRKALAVRVPGAIVRITVDNG